MELSVNGITIPAAAIEREAAELEGVPDADAAARRTLAIRELLLQRAGELGLLEDGAPRAKVAFAGREAEEEIIGRVLDAEVTTPEPDESECRRVYDAHPERWTTGELVEARHILFAVTAGTPVSPLRARAEAMLAALLTDPAAFAGEARAWSNCPSGETGGSLGQFGRGQMVAEFDRAVFGATATGVLPELVHSRYGFHIVASTAASRDARCPSRPCANGSRHRWWPGCRSARCGSTCRFWPAAPSLPASNWTRRRRRWCSKPRPFDYRHPAPLARRFAAPQLGSRRELWNNRRQLIVAGVTAMLDRDGYRPNVAIVIVNARNQVFWGKRIREHSWQFPQGGINPGETPEAGDVPGAP